MDDGWKDGGWVVSWGGVVKWKTDGIDVADSEKSIVSHQTDCVKSTAIRVTVTDEEEKPWR